MNLFRGFVLVIALFCTAEVAHAEGRGIEISVETGPTIHLRDKNDDGMYRVLIEQFTEKPLVVKEPFGQRFEMKPAFSFGNQASMTYVGAELPWRTTGDKSRTELSWGLVYLIDWNEKLTGTRWQHQLSVSQSFQFSKNWWIRSAIVHYSNGAGYAGGEKPNPGENYYTLGLTYVLD